MLPSTLFILLLFRTVYSEFSSSRVISFKSHVIPFKIIDSPFVFSTSQTKSFHYLKDLALPRTYSLPQLILFSTTSPSLSWLHMVCLLSLTCAVHCLRKLLYWLTDSSVWNIVSWMYIWLYPSVPSSLLRYYFPVRLTLITLLKLQSPPPPFGSLLPCSFFFIHGS